MRLLLLLTTQCCPQGYDRWWAARQQFGNLRTGACTLACMARNYLYKTHSALAVSMLHNCGWTAICMATSACRVALQERNQMWGGVKATVSKHLCPLPQDEFVRWGVVWLYAIKQVRRSRRSRRSRHSSHGWP